VKRWNGVRGGLKEMLLATAGCAGDEKKRRAVSSSQDENDGSTNRSKRKRRKVATRKNAAVDSDSDFDSCSEDDYDPSSHSDSSESDKKKPSTKERTTKQLSEAPPNKLTRKPPAYYHGLNRKKLAALCEAENLPTNGSEKELRERHALFLLVYNAESDASHPRSHAEIVKEVIKRERGKKEATGMVFTGTGDRVYLDKMKNGVKDGVITSGNDRFDKKIDDGFKQLVQAYRRKEKGLPPATDEDNQSINQLCHPDDDTSKVKITQPQISNTAPSATTTRRNVKKKEDGVAQVFQNARVTRNKTRVARTTSRPVGSSIGPWTCSMCTFINTARKGSNVKCEMCGCKRSETAASKVVVEVDC